MAAGTFRSMSIQFLCPACSQPIEVDDQWSARPVACPFCRKTVTAPAASTFEPLAAPPAASAVPVPQPGAELDARTQARAGLAGGNALAVWALGLASAALLLNLISSVLLAGHASEFADPAGAQEMTKRMLEGEMPSWFAWAVLSSAAVLACWLAGIICGIIALRRPTGRGLAIASLAISGVMLVLFCAGLGTALGGGAG